MIVVFGSINVDLISRVRHIAAPGETVLSDNYALSFGGKGANQAAAAATAVAQAVAPAVMMIGALGKDDFAARCLDNFARRAINCQHIQKVDEPTGVAFISVDDRGENAITVASGANNCLSAALVAPSALDGAAVVVMQMETPLDENIAFAHMAKARNIPVIFNFAPAKENVPWHKISEILSLTDYLIVNEHEAEVVARLMGEQGLEHFPKIVKQFSDKNCGENEEPEPLPQPIFVQMSQYFSLTLIVTLGGEGVDIVTANAPVVHIDAHKITVEDTTGAGDFFVGIFAAHLAALRGEGDGKKEISHHDCLQAVESANSQAAASCQWLGAQKPLI